MNLPLILFNKTLLLSSNIAERLLLGCSALGIPNTNMTSQLIDSSDANVLDNGFAHVARIFCLFSKFPGADVTTIRIVGIGLP